MKSEYNIKVATVNRIDIVNLVLDEIDENHTQVQAKCGGFWYWVYIVGEFAILDLADTFEIWI